MKFIHMHESLRQKILRKIGDGGLTVTILARQTGLAQAHVSNFLREIRLTNEPEAEVRVFICAMDLSKSDDVRTVELGDEILNDTRLARR